MVKLEKRVSPESSNIELSSYNYDTKVLTIIFKGGNEYQYKDVPEDVWIGMKGSESVGKFFYAYIKNKFDFVKA